jgi:hypothetical protein
MHEVGPVRGAAEESERRVIARLLAWLFGPCVNGHSTRASDTPHPWPGWDARVCRRCGREWMGFRDLVVEVRRDR